MCNNNSKLSWKYVYYQVPLSNEKLIIKDQNLYFMGWHFLIEKIHGGNAKPISSLNATSNSILKIIQSVLGNIVWKYNIKYTYVDDNYPWIGILVAAAFTTFSTVNRLKGYTLVWLIFGRDTIILIQHITDWQLLIQKKQ